MRLQVTIGASGSPVSPLVLGTSPRKGNVGSNPTAPTTTLDLEFCFLLQILHTCMLLTCTKCSKEKDEHDFRWRIRLEGKRQSWCKECFKEHERRAWQDNPERRKSAMDSNTGRRKRNAQFVWDYLVQHPCVMCGESDPVVLEFDHREQSIKKGTICDMSRTSMGLETITEEIQKCDVLCANCHRRRTAEQMGWYKSIRV